jgi:hypothetical protein
MFRVGEFNAQCRLNSITFCLHARPYFLGGIFFSTGPPGSSDDLDREGRDPGGGRLATPDGAAAGSIGRPQASRLAPTTPRTGIVVVRGRARRAQRDGSVGPGPARQRASAALSRLTRRRAGHTEPDAGPGISGHSRPSSKVTEVTKVAGIDVPNGREPTQALSRLTPIPPSFRWSTSPLSPFLPNPTGTNRYDVDPVSVLTDFETGTKPVCSGWKRRDFPNDFNVVPVCSGWISHIRGREGILTTVLDAGGCRGRHHIRS